MRVLVAVDLGDERVEAAVDEAARWVSRMGATADLGHAEGARYQLDWVADPSVRKLMEKEADQLRRRDAARLTELLERFPERCRGVGRLLSGPPVSAIVQASEDYDAVLIATHGRSGFSHFWLGSVAEQVVRKAHCAVVVMRLRPA